jgi:eukaryotic-like serine/threonine-protein kinase
MPVTSSPRTLTGAVSDRYLIEDELGRGGTAIVYRARDTVRGSYVAIKVLREDAIGSLSVERFLREIRTTAQLPHPHIVPVLDAGEHEGRPYFVLPYMEGGTLRARLQREKQLSLAEVVSLGVTMCKALDFAHKRGLIHRDVKPENILFSGDTPCLADFGTARALEKATNESTTSTGIVRGTPLYMSPEQASGEREYDGRSDIYSLACVLYEAVAGVPPFMGATAQAIISQRLTHPPRPVSVYRPTTPPALEAILEKATALLPADRHAGALPAKRP